MYAKGLPSGAGYRWNRVDCGWPLVLSMSSVHEKHEQHPADEPSGWMLSCPGKYVFLENIINCLLISDAFVSILKALRVVRFVEFLL